MAVLEKIRERGLLLVIVIGLAIAWMYCHKDLLHQAPPSIKCVAKE